MRLLRTLAVIAPLFVARVAGAQLLNTGVGPNTTFRGADSGPGQGVAVSTQTELTQIGFYVGSPLGGTVKYGIFDGASSNLLFSTTVSVGATADGTLLLSDPFNFILNAGQTYDFGVLSDNNLNVSYFYSSPTPVSQNGLTVVGNNTNYVDFGSPVFAGDGGATIALALYGTQGSVPPTVVPEPASLALFGTGLSGLGGMMAVRRRKVIAG